VSGTARPSLDGRLSIGTRVAAVEVTRQPPRALQPSFNEVYVTRSSGARANVHLLGDRGTVRLVLDDVKRFGSGASLLTISPCPERGWGAS
jgi:hypothetical protein